MTLRRLVVLGGGEHARVVIDAARSALPAWEVLGVVDPGTAERTRTLLAVEHLGDDEGFSATLDALSPAERPHLVLGLGAIGDPEARRVLVARYDGRAPWATLVHGAAWVAPSATLAPGAVVLAAAAVNAGARIGAHAVVNTGAVLEHDAVLGEYAQLAPGAVVGGGAVVEAGAYVGLGALVRDHVTVGRGSIVGMGAAAVADVPAGAVVIGVPARRHEAGR
ncbi:MAG: NeuD/PglB/VioB family sugar acetyltransferase [Chloroflexota bacterium]